MNVEVQLISEFNAEFIREVFESLDISEVQPNHRFFEQNKTVFMVARLDQQIAGCLYAYELEHPDEPRTNMFLYSIDTATRFRKQGVGRRMIERLKEEAALRGCFEIFVLTNQNNLAAMQLYKGTGGIRENEDDIMFVYGLPGA